MNRTCFMHLMLGLIASLYPAVVQAQDATSNSQNAPNDILTAIPADAWAVLCIPDVGHLDAKLATLGNRLNLPVLSAGPLAVAKAVTGLAAGIDDGGSLALVLLPVKDYSKIGQSMVLFIPTSQYDALSIMMMSQPVDDRISKVSFLGRESYMARHGRFAVLAQTGETIRGILAGQVGIRSRLNDHQLERFKTDDVTLLMNAAAVTSADLFPGLVSQLAITDAQADVLRQVISAQLSLRLDPTGATTSLYVRADPQSGLGRWIGAAPATSDPLLYGLPGGPFILAAGRARTSEQSRQEADAVGRMLRDLANGNGKSAGVLASLRPMIEYLVASTTNVAISVTQLAPGPDGMFAVTAILRSDGKSRRISSTIAAIIQIAREGFDNDSRPGELLQMIDYKPKAEITGDTNVDQVIFNIRPEADPLAVETIQRILGHEGPRLRIAAVDDNHLALTFGGGLNRMTRVVETLRTNGTTLADNDAIRRAAASVPQKRAAELFFAIDSYSTLMSNVLKAIDQPAPFSISQVDAPIALVFAPAGDAAAQVDIFTPLELIIALKDAWSRRTAPEAHTQTEQPGDADKL